ncbi:MULTISPECIES: sensor histidine kinase [Streptomyces]|uniref:histidine kinase n=2 Tax=Streptomyces rimosus subsp. rimosus TaxID=132474 RepID=L8EQX7_STRR1|nr:MULTISPECIES: HAMP domain-containing sensor histidine kinase [Streptomyces]KOG72171.1 histidine kinase [Kitasatospora aureofaciens]MYT42352.1 HAMP domain-containing protein [Streptomyces sp. SID5471]KEF06414.1 histidine kinase [Streptomyces rimosus]KOT36317.1 histidine kinase [Streptomyces sp. NRRL WC-3701]KOT37139.1 histidine kinase [Streptomyces rimosus subsp. rimosus]
MSGRRGLGARWRRHRPLRTRLAIATSAAVAVVAVGICVAAFFITKHQMTRQLDFNLAQTANQYTQQYLKDGPSAGDTGCRYLAVPCVQSAPADPSKDPRSPYALPVDDDTRAVAAGRRTAYYKKLTVAGWPVRMYTTKLPGKHQALQVALRSDVVQRGVQKAALALAGVGGTGVLLAAGLGYWVSRTGLAPVARLTATAERIAATRDARHRIELPPGPPGRQDEITRLAASFNTMLGELEQSVAAQRRLVADASHELRTPLTALRTNAELLARSDRLTDTQRDRASGALGRQLREVTTLVNDLIELARDEEPQPLVEQVRPAVLLEHAVEAARGHWPEIGFTVRTDEAAAGAAVPGVPARLSRLLSNLLDNAAKFSPPGGPVETALTVSAGALELTVRDHGPGISAEDLPHVFDRFYRAEAARALPGSGLGLAMARQIARAHHAELTAAQAPGGGAVFRLRFPAG